MKRVLLVFFLIFCILEILSQNSLKEDLSDSIVYATPKEDFYEKLSTLAQESSCFCSKKVYFKITVQKNGELSKVEIMKGTESCWDDTLKTFLINSSPWNPAKKNNVPIDFEMIYPIRIGTVINYPCQKKRK